MEAVEDSLVEGIPAVDNLAVAVLAVDNPGKVFHILIHLVQKDCYHMAGLAFEAD